MFLACLLLDEGLQLERPQRNSPDIALRIAGNRVWVEAVTAEPGDLTKLDSAHRRYSSAAGANPAQAGHIVQISAESCSVVQTPAQTKQYSRFLRNGKCSPSEAYVVAVNVREIPMPASL